MGCGAQKANRPADSKTHAVPTNASKTPNSTRRGSADRHSFNTADIPTRRPSCASRLTSNRPTKTTGATSTRPENAPAFHQKWPWASHNRLEPNRAAAKPWSNPGTGLARKSCQPSASQRRGEVRVMAAGGGAWASFMSATSKRRGQKDCGQGAARARCAGTGAHKPAPNSACRGAGATVTPARRCLARPPPRPAAPAPGAPGPRSRPGRA